MSRFWTYFRETLAWPLIWKPGPLSVLVEGLARVMDGVLEDILWLRAQFSPATCDEQFILRFAQARGIRRSHLEDDARFAARVRKAYAWQLLGGLTAGMPKVLEHYGYPNAQVVNKRSEDEERWAEFDVNLAAQEGLTERDYELLDWVANDAKAASAKLAGINVTANSSVPAPAASVCCSGEVVVVWPLYPSVVAATRADAGLTVRAVGTETLTVTPLAVTDVDSWVPTVIAAGAQAFDFVTIYPEA